MLGLATLLWGFLQGPFDHIHPGEALEDHQATSAPVHLHIHETFSEHGSFIAAHSPDDDEIDVPWNAGMSAHVVFHHDAELSERDLVPAPAVASAAILVPQHRGHDPPESSPKIPRAPPA